MRADAIRNRKRLLEVAEGLFTAKGPNVEMDEIAEAAAVGVGTIYRHFATKEALVQAIVVGPIEELIEEAAALANARDAGDAFFTFFASLVQRATAKHHLADAFSKSGRVHYGTPAELESRRRRFRAAFGVLLERAQQAGAVRADIRTPELVALVNGAFPYLQRDGGDRKAGRRLLAFIVDALAKRARPR
jgi:AcrR family transcriptional regulator